MPTKNIELNDSCPENLERNLANGIDDNHNDGNNDEYDDDDDDNDDLFEESNWNNIGQQQQGPIEIIENEYVLLSQSPTRLTTTEDGEENNRVFHQHNLQFEWINTDEVLFDNRESNRINQTIPASEQSRDDRREMISSNDDAGSSFSNDDGHQDLSDREKDSDELDKGALIFSGN